LEAFAMTDKKLLFGPTKAKRAANVKIWSSDDFKDSAAALDKKTGRSLEVVLLGRKVSINYKINNTRVFSCAMWNNTIWRNLTNVTNW
jgi:hypothetical protein